jgi:hypothetical protein
MLTLLAAAELNRYVAEIQKFQNLNPVPNLELLIKYRSSPSQFNIFNFNSNPIALTPLKKRWLETGHRHSRFPI